MTKNEAADHGQYALTAAKFGALRWYREERARAAARLIRVERPYRWVGLYDVTEEEIAIIAWDGPEPQAYPRFPVSRGLNGAAVASRRPVIVQDVASDPRHRVPSFAKALAGTILGQCGSDIA